MASVTGFCPDGGTFYVCQGNSTQFLGCCTDDPCSDRSGDCPQSSLRYTSYNSDDYDSIPAEACASSGLWYTCSGITTAFMGCCLENPCQNDGCTQGNLTAATLSDNTTEAAPFMTSTASSSGGGHMKMLSTGAIVGIAIGAALGALITGIILFLLYKRRERRKGQQGGAINQSAPDGTPGMYMPSPYQDSTGFPSPQFPLGAEHVYGSDKMTSGWPSPPGQIPNDHRPVSTAPSWMSGGYSGHGRAPSDPPSVSSMGSSKGGLHFLFNQQIPPSHLNPLAEMDGADVPRPMSELAGSPPQGMSDHIYEAGYNRIATRGDT